MIELSEEQKKAVADAQATFTELKDNSKPLNDEQLNLLFGQARSMNGWQDKEVTDDTVKSIYELLKWVLQAQIVVQHALNLLNLMSKSNF